jgi:diphosphomevalonate decarboxylase
MKATARAPSNIAFIKYWGRKDEDLRLPTNGSISMNLSNLTTTTTVEFNPSFKKDDFIIDGKKDAQKESRVILHLDRIRKIAQILYKAKVVSQNNFPSDTGLSSSASGFAALTVAATKAAGLKLSQKELTILARTASGSACRSIPDGFVYWRQGQNNDTSFAYSIFPANWWNIIDVVVILSDQKKDVSTSLGQKSIASSPFMQTRLLKINNKLDTCRKLLKEKDFNLFGELIEQEALELHAIMITSIPPLLYWLPQTIMLMKLVLTWRAMGLPVFFTLNTGQNIHIICEKKTVPPLMEKLKTVSEIKKIIINTPAIGAHITSDHLF